MPDDEPIVAGELTIRPDLFDAFVADDAAGLSRKEYDLLRHLSGADGRVLEREQIYQRVWGYTMVRGDRSVDVFVRKLRNKLERVSPDWRYVHTHFGIGYRFAPERVDGAPVQPAEPTESVQPAESTESAQPAGPAAGADGRAPVSGSGSPNSDGSAVRLELTSDRLTVS
jgi:DNA-binding winged helix-turn-helix (wHTH) protein